MQIGKKRRVECYKSKNLRRRKVLGQKLFDYADILYEQYQQKFLKISISSEDQAQLHVNSDCSECECISQVINTKEQTNKNTIFAQTICQSVITMNGFKSFGNLKFLLIILSLQFLRMFNDSYLPSMISNRMHQKNLSAFINVRITNLQAYSSTVIAMLEVRIFFSLMALAIRTHFYFCQTQLQMCDVNGLKKQTKYLIKKSMDTYILIHPSSTPNEIQFSTINLYRLAIKQNQDPSKFGDSTIQKCMQMIGPQYSRQDFIDFELQLYKRAEFNMNFTTPYDYLGVHASVFPLDSKQTKKINFILDFSFVIPELMFSSAQQIFYGCLLKIYEQNPTQKAWILRQTYSQQESLRVNMLMSQFLQLQVQAASNVQFQ